LKKIIKFVEKYQDMKKIILVLSLTFFGVLISCKNDESKANQDKITETTTEVKKDTLFTITLNATVLKDDSFQVYYKSQGEERYIEEKSQFTEFKGSDKPQNIVFRLPDGVIPDNIRLDFGTNKDQEPIKINNFKVSYFGKDFSVNGTDFFKYLLVEKVTADYDPATAMISPKDINGIHDPQSTSEKGLYDEIQKLIK
jgi:hypothetical protein